MIRDVAATAAGLIAEGRESLRNGDTAGARRAFVRMLSSFGCDNTLRWAARYRDLRAPRATRLEDRLEQMGGYCDCELLLNGYGSVADDASLRRCVGVPRSSTKPCDLWQRHRRW